MEQMLATYIFRRQKQIRTCWGGKHYKAKKRNTKCSEEGAVFRQNNIFLQNRSVLASKVQLVPLKKLNTHTLWFHPQIKELLTLLRDKIVLQSRHLQWNVF